MPKCERNRSDCEPKRTICQGITERVHEGTFKQRVASNKGRKKRGTKFNVNCISSRSQTYGKAYRTRSPGHERVVTSIIIPKTSYITFLSRSRPLWSQTEPTRTLIYPLPHSTNIQKAKQNSHFLAQSSREPIQDQKDTLVAYNTGVDTTGKSPAAGHLSAARQFSPLGRRRQSNGLFLWHLISSGKYHCRRWKDVLWESRTKSAWRTVG